MARMSSPGVYVKESDQSHYSEVMDASKVIAIVGGGQNGPINTVVPLKSKKEFENTFGAPIDFGGLTAINTLKYSSTVLYVRAAGSSAEERSVTLAGKSESDADVSDALIIKHKHKGTIHKDKLSATVNKLQGESADRFNLVITKGEGDEVLNKDYSVIVGSSDYIGADTSTDFIFVVSETELGSITPVESALFSDGDNGTPLTGEDLKSAVEVLSDKETLDIDLVSIPGTTDGTALSALLGVVTKRMDCVAILDPPQGLSPEETVEYFEGLSGDYQVARVDTSYATGYSPWGEAFNPYAGENQWCPPSVGILPAMAEEYATYDPWTAPAGIPRFVVKEFSRFERTLDQDDRDILYSGNVNPICNYKNLGFTALGQKTMQRTKSAVDRLNARFLVNHVKKIAEFKSAKYLFMDIDDSTFGSWIQDLSKDLDNIKQRGGVYDYILKMDWETVDSEMLNNNIMPGVVQIKPTKTAEFIPIDVVIRNRDDEF